MGSQHPLRDERGLHLKAWRGNSHFWTIMFSANSQGSLTGHLSAKRAIIARVHTAEEYERILETKIPILPACLRQPVAAALEVRALASLSSGQARGCELGASQGCKHARQIELST